MGYLWGFWPQENVNFQTDDPQPYITRWWEWEEKKKLSTHGVQALLH